MDSSCLASTELSSDFGPHHLQHDQLASTQLVTKGNDGFLVTWHCNVEDVDAGVEAADLGTTLEFPETDGSVSRARYDDLAIWRDGAAPDLHMVKPKV